MFLAAFLSSSFLYFHFLSLAITSFLFSLLSPPLFRFSLLVFLYHFPEFSLFYSSFYMFCTFVWILFLSYLILFPLFFFIFLIFILFSFYLPCYFVYSFCYRPSLSFVIFVSVPFFSISDFYVVFSSHLFCQLFSLSSYRPNSSLTLFSHILFFISNLFVRISALTSPSFHYFSPLLLLLHPFFPHCPIIFFNWCSVFSIWYFNGWKLIVFLFLLSLYLKIFFTIFILFFKPRFYAGVEKCVTVMESYFRVGVLPNYLFYFFYCCFCWLSNDQDIIWKE